jgi:N-acetylglucosamine-6-sulfatase
VAAGCAALIALAWLASGSTAGGAAPQPLAAASAESGKGTGKKCDEACQARRKQHLKKLRRQNAHQKRPNVIVIETDDQNQTDMVAMPKTEALLAGHGTTFSNSYVEYPLCCPSRATFLTGQYAHNHHVISTELPNGYNGLNHANTLPVWLRHAKYRTAMVGKYLNGYGINDGIPEPFTDAREIPPGWTQWYALTGGTEQRRYRYRVNENGRLQFYGSGARNYVEDVLQTKVASLIRGWAPNPRPFFLWYTPSAPHGERGVPFGSTRDPEPAPRYLGVYGDAQAPRTPNFDEADVSDKPKLIRDESRLNTDQINDIDRRFRGRMESLLTIDDHVQNIVRLLAKNKDLRKTYIIFTSDNGLQLGAHRLIFKDALYEESTRVPLIIRGPKFPQGVIRDQLVSNIDLAPTIVSLTGARPGLAMDGIDLLPLAENPSVAANRDLLFEVFDFNIFGIRRGNWVYNQYSNGDEELYNLLEDPYELKSRDGDPSLAGMKDELAARLAQLKACAGPSCR